MLSSSVSVEVTIREQEIEPLFGIHRIYQAQAEINARFRGENFHWHGPLGDVTSLKPTSTKEGLEEFIHDNLLNALNTAYGWHLPKGLDSEFRHWIGEIKERLKTPADPDEVPF